MATPSPERRKRKIGPGSSPRIKVAAGKTLDRRGRPLLIKLKGQVQASLRS